VSGTATLNASAGLITSEALSGVTTYSLNLVNSVILASSIVYVTAYTGSATLASVTNIVPAGGSAVIALLFSASFTGTAKIAFMVSN